MPDREKVTEALNCVANAFQSNCMKCDYYVRTDVPYVCNYLRLMRDALALLQEQEHKDKMFHALESDWKQLKELLKEQEAVEPKSHPAKAWTRAKTLWFCGACGARISKRKTKFCQECGRSVKWNDKAGNP